MAQSYPVQDGATNAPAQQLAQMHIAPSRTSGRQSQQSPAGASTLAGGPMSPFTMAQPNMYTDTTRQEAIPQQQVYQHYQAMVMTQQQQQHLQSMPHPYPGDGRFQHHYGPGNGGFYDPQSMLTAAGPHLAQYGGMPSYASQNYRASGAMLGQGMDSSAYPSRHRSHTQQSDASMGGMGSAKVFDGDRLRPSGIVKGTGPASGFDSLPRKPWTASSSPQEGANTTQATAQTGGSNATTPPMAQHPTVVPGPPTVPLLSRLPPLPPAPVFEGEGASLEEARKAYEAREEALALRIEAIGFNPADALRVHDELNREKSPPQADIPTSPTTKEGERDTRQEMPHPVLGVRLLQRLTALETQTRDLESNLRRQTFEASADLAALRQELQDSHLLIEKLDTIIGKREEECQKSETRCILLEQALNAACAAQSKPLSSASDTKGDKDPTTTKIPPNQKGRVSSPPTSQGNPRNAVARRDEAGRAAHHPPPRDAQETKMQTSSSMSRDDANHNQLRGGKGSGRGARPHRNKR